MFWFETSFMTIGDMKDIKSFFSVSKQNIKSSNESTRELFRRINRQQAHINAILKYNNQSHIKTYKNR